MARFKHVASGAELEGMEYTGDDAALEEFVAGRTEGIDPKVGQVVISDPGEQGTSVFVLDAADVERVE